MRRVIQGKMYDTEKSILIGGNWNGLGSNDFRYQNEEMYITKKGAFFIVGEGGAMSIYSESNGRETWGSKELIEYSREEAYEWLEENNEIDAIEKYFSDNLQDA